MFNACRVKLFSGRDWIFLRLNGPLPLPFDRMDTQAEMWQWVAHYQTSGQFMIRENSLTKSVDPGKFIISQSRWPEVFWAYNHVEQAVDFISRGYYGGGGLEHGGRELRFNTLLTLYNAQITRRGMEPLDRSRTGRAIVRSGGHMAFLTPGTMINWEWRSWDWPISQEVN